MAFPSLRSFPAAFVCALSVLTLLQPARASASTGCGKSLPAGQKIGSTTATSLTTDDDILRTYRIYIPQLYSNSKATPLIINYHGRSSSGKEQEQMTGMSLPAWNNDTIVIYPDGLNAEWEGDPDVHGVDDIAFTQDLVTKISSQYCIDSSRVYAIGSSNGGGFVGNYLACSDWGLSTFAVFGAAYGAFYTNTSDTECAASGKTSSKFSTTSFTTMDVPITCNSTKANVPMIEFHGTGDQTIPYDGGDRRGFCLPALPHWVTSWASRTGLGSSNTSQSLFNGQTFKYQFGSGSQQGQVTHYEVIGMGHTWPVTTGNTAPFNATPIVMDFFRTWGAGDNKAAASPSGTASGTATTGSTAATASSTKHSAASSLSQSVFSPLSTIFLAGALVFSLFVAA